MDLELTELFANVLAQNVAPKPSVITISHAGNWKALQPCVRSAFPKIEFNSGARHPVLLGGKKSIYLDKIGSTGAVQFKDSVRHVLERNERLFVFDAQKVEALASDPTCISDLVGPRQIAAFHFRDAIPLPIEQFLQDQGNKINWTTSQVREDSLSVIATTISSKILSEEFANVVRLVTKREQQVLEDMRSELLKDLAPDVEDNFLEGSSGVPKLREFARRKIASALLRSTTPTYSVKSGRDCIDFYREELAAKFERHQLPVCYLSEISPNLNFVVKHKKRFTELHR